MTLCRLCDNKSHCKGLFSNHYKIELKAIQADEEDTHKFWAWVKKELKL